MNLVTMPTYRTALNLVASTLLKLLALSIPVQLSAQITLEPPAALLEWHNCFHQLVALLGNLGKQPWPNDGSAQVTFL